MGAILRYTPFTDPIRRIIRGFLLTRICSMSDVSLVMVSNSTIRHCSAKKQITWRYTGIYMSCGRKRDISGWIRTDSINSESCNMSHRQTYPVNIATLRLVLLLPSLQNNQSLSSQLVPWGNAYTFPASAKWRTCDAIRNYTFLRNSAPESV